MRIKIYSILTIISAILISCDCQYEVSGIVLDADSNEPIYNVAIGKTDTTELDNPFNSKTFTQENGYYNISGIGGSCKNVTLYFSEKNYQTLKLEFENGSIDTVFVQKKEN